jgi:hypothetical protein
MFNWQGPIYVHTQTHTPHPSPPPPHTHTHVGTATKYAPKKICAYLYIYMIYTRIYISVYDLYAYLHTWILSYAHLHT